MTSDKIAHLWGDLLTNFYYQADIFISNPKHPKDLTSQDLQLEAKEALTELFPDAGTIKDVPQLFVNTDILALDEGFFIDDKNKRLFHYRVRYEQTPDEIFRGLMPYQMRVEIYTTDD